MLANLSLGCWLTGDWSRLLEYVQRMGCTYDTEAATGRVLAQLVARTTGRDGEASGLSLDTPTSSLDDVVKAWLIVAAEFGHELPHVEALVEAVSLYRGSVGFGEDFWFLWPLAVDAALEQGRFAAARELLAPVEAARRTTLSPLVAAQLFRLRGALARAQPAGDRAAAEADLRAAVLALDDFGAVFYAARARFSLAELLVEQGRVEEAEPLLAPARETFDRLGAAPWLDRVTGLQARSGQSTLLR